MRYQTQWETELNNPLDAEDWQRIWLAVSKSSKNVIFMEYSYKVLCKVVLMALTILKPASEGVAWMAP